MTTQLWAIGLALLSVAIGAWGPILLKKGAHKLSFNIFHNMKNFNLIAGIAVYGVATIIYLAALRGGELSVLYPLVSLSYPAVAILSVWLLGERMNWVKWLGIVCILAGISLIGLA